MKMREIKFRAWDKEQRKMWQTGLSSPHLQFNNGEIFWLYDRGHKLQNGIDKSIVLMQYTGLKDKNGKEIYEGDIVKWDEGANISQVVWWNEHGQFMLKDGVNDGVGIGTMSLELIGNIYENPELLTERK